MSPLHDDFSRRVAAILLPLAAVCPVVACGNGDRDPALARGSTVVVATDGVSGLLPTYTSLEYVPFSPLAAWGTAGEREPRLATSWTSSPDGRVRTYRLRQDVRWHDGHPFTAHDVKFTLDLLRHPEVLGATGAGIDSVWVEDDSTVSVAADRPSYLDDTPVYPRHLLAELEPAQIWSWDFWKQPVGTGPFRWVRHVPQSLMEFEANPDYFRGEPRVASLILKFVGDAKIPELLSGNADIADDVRSEDWTQIAADGRFAAVHAVYASGGAMGLYFNHRHRLFSDSRVRLAVALALDRREILRALSLPADVHMFDVPVTGHQAIRGDFPPPLPHDPDRARALLEAAGWKDADGDGVREKDGVTARFELVSRSPSRAVLVQEHLHKVGLRAEILDLEPAAVWQRVRGGDFDAAIQVVQDNTEWLRRYFGEGSVTGYANRRVSELLDRAARASVEDSVDAAYAAIAEVFRRDLPIVFLQPWIKTQFVHRRIRGPRTRLGGNLIRQLDDLWVQEP